MKGKHVVFLVPSTSHAVRGEHVLNQAGIASKLIPVPRHISSDCGVCIRVTAEDRATAQEALQVARVQVESIHEF
jgi:hypothetical protein